MAKKEKIHIQHSDELEEVDEELAAAMQQLDDANTRVGDLLQSYAPPPPETILALQAEDAEAVGAVPDATNAESVDGDA